MAPVHLSILEPAHGSAVPAGATVTFRGRVDRVDPAAGPLQHRWWSSLPTDPPRPPPAPPPALDLDDVALGTSLHATARLSIGSHVVTLSAKDVPGDDAASLAAVGHAGTAGGAPPDAPAPCVLHVVGATLLLPPDDRVSRSVGVAALAPPVWPEPAYQAVNALAYHWRFRPEPADGRPEVVIAPAAADLGFAGAPEPTDAARPFLPPPPVPPRVVVRLPGTLSTDARPYRLTLTVSAAGVQHRVEKLVRVVP